MHKIVSTQIALIADNAWRPVADYPTAGYASWPRRRSARTA
jgi:hypothetical protein